MTMKVDEMTEESFEELDRQEGYKEFDCSNSEDAWYRNKRRR